MEVAYGQPPVIGLTITLEEAKTDYSLYDSLYKASGNGATMPSDQLKRYLDLKAMFEGA